MSGLISENHRIVATIDPDAYGTGAQTSDVIDMMHYDSVLFVVMAGDLGSSATLDFLVKGDTASNGSFTDTITGKSITQLTQAGTDSDKQALVEVTQADVVAQGFRYIRATMTVGTATSDCGAVALGRLKHYAGDNSTFDLDSVDEILN